MKLLQKIILLTAVFFTSSCYVFFDPMPKNWDWGIKPRPLRGVRGFPDASTPYGTGFKDGCAAAWDTTTRGLLGDMKAKYDFKRSQKSGDYESGWWDGMEQCVYITNWDVY